MTAPLRTIASPVGTPAPPQDVLEFVTLEVPYRYRGSVSPGMQRKLVTSIRRLWPFLKRPPQFADLHEKTLRAFGEHLLAQKLATETINDNLRYAWETAALAHRQGYIPHEPPYLQLVGGQLVERPRAKRRPAQYAAGGGWDLPDIQQLFAALGAVKGNVGSIPNCTWWTILALFILDSGAKLSQCLALTWKEIDLERGTVQLGDKQSRLRDGTVAALEALKLFCQPAVFPPPSSSSTAFQLVYRHLKRILVEAGLGRRSCYPLDRLAKVGPSDAMIEQLAGLVVIRHPSAAAESPPLRPGRTAKGLRVYYSPAEGERVPDVQLTARMTLVQFYTAWMRPVILDSAKQVAVGTLEHYTGALAWWEVITGDPPLVNVDDKLWGQFEAGLRDARFKRGPLSEERPLSGQTQAGHKRTIRTILQRAAQKQICTLPVMIVPNGKADKKEAFTVAAAKKIVGWLRAEPGPESELPPGPGRRRIPVYPLRMPNSWWLAIVATAFYTGLRISEVMSLRWGMLLEREDGGWLDVPAEAVPKTGKAINIGVHDCLREALAAIGPGPAEELIFSWPGHYTHLVACHRRLQSAAGVIPILPPHAWRRTHATELGKTFLQQAIQAAQAGLNHASSKTTEDHYLTDELRALAIRSLPRLW